MKFEISLFPFERRNQSFKPSAIVASVFALFQTRDYPDRDVSYNCDFLCHR
nr:hypothetical protein [uncultured bacterium]